MLKLWRQFAGSDVYLHVVPRGQNVSATGEGQYPGTGDEDPQLAQGIVDGATDLVTISIGGNDARFEKVAVACIVKPNCEDREAPGSGGLTWGEYLPQHISVTVKDAVKMLYQETKSAAPNAAVVALGYPLLVSGIECPDLSVPFLGFSEEEQQFVREMVDLVNEVLEDAAQEVGIHFLDVATEFSDHEICDSDPWIHSIKKIPFVFSIHPT
ncbi:MAG: GDSL-type esterase/lipase family protein, partial [Planctomycetota bacterium]